MASVLAPFSNVCASHYPHAPRPLAGRIEGGGVVIWSPSLEAQANTHLASGGLAGSGRAPRHWQSHRMAICAAIEGPGGEGKREANAPIVSIDPAWPIPNPRRSNHSPSQATTSAPWAQQQSTRLARAQPNYSDPKIATPALEGRRGSARPKRALGKTTNPNRAKTVSMPTRLITRSELGFYLTGTAALVARPRSG